MKGARPIEVSNTHNRHKINVQLFYPPFSSTSSLLHGWWIDDDEALPIATSRPQRGPSRVCGVFGFKSRRVLRIALIARCTRFVYGHILSADRPKNQLDPTSSGLTLYLFGDLIKC
jgi:hypothetical protein